jgi:hypothetical protein
MATLAEAEAARLAEEDRFGALGARAIEIQPLRDRSGYELIVHFAATPPAGVPRSVAVTRGARTAIVPVRAIVRPHPRMQT